MKFVSTALLALLFLGTPAVAVASSPGLIEGPAGCTWNATVKKVGKSSISVHVDEQYGSCVDELCPVDAEGKTYSLTGKKKYQTGQVIKIWVDLDKKDKERATLDVPKCWSQTVMLPEAPEDIAPAAGPAPAASADISDLKSAKPLPSSHMSDFDPSDMPPVEAFPPAPVSKE